jgi:hypothetical protein
MADIFSTGSLLVHGPTVLTNLLSFVIYQYLESAGASGTLEMAYMKLAWSYNMLYAGLWDENDWDGNPMPDGMCTNTPWKKSTRTCT